MRRSWIAVLAAGAIASAGCTSIVGEDWHVVAGLDPAGAGASGAGGAGGAGVGGAGSRVDLGAGTWVLENASGTPGTISHDGALAILADGTRWASWSEPDAVALGDQDIWVSERQGDGSWAGEARTDDVDVQYAYASMRSAGNVLYLVFSGAPGVSSDIFYASHASDGWSNVANLTKAFDSTPPRNDHEPSLAVGPGGELAVAYISQPDASGSTEIRVMRFDAGGSGSAPETVIDGSYCDRPSAVFDAAAHLHVVASCAVSDQVLYYATDASGSWTKEALPGGSKMHPEVALDPDGTTLHVVWVGTPKCADGVSSCDDILYARSVGGAFPATVEVTATDDARETWPTLVVDAYGRPIVAFHVFDADNMADVFVSWSEDGGTSFEPRRLVTTPGGAGDEWFPAFMSVDPKTGLPELVYEATIPDSDPLDTEIMRAYLAQ